MPSKLLPHGSRGLSLRRGLTLVEMLISMTVSLIMIYAMLRFFGDLMTDVADGRAAIEMSGQLRSAADRLHEDLRGVTTPVRPWHDPASGLGYFEYVENVGNDYQPLGWLTGTTPAPNLATSAFGDIDDVVAFTTRSSGRPFVGQFRRRLVSGDFSTLTTDSHYAEVVWWTRWMESPTGTVDALEPGEVTLYRRALLVRPDLGLVDEWTESDPGSSDPAAWADIRERLEDFYRYNDISVRPEVTISSGTIRFRFWANSLADLAKRENRYCHRPILRFTSPTAVELVDDTMLVDLFPYPLNVRGMMAFPPPPEPGDLPSLYWVVQDEDEEGEDVMLSHATAFDVQAFDPLAPVRANRSDAALVSELLVPSDPGYTDTPIVSLGTYVDLAYSDTYFSFNGKPPAVSHFSALSSPTSLWPFRTNVYDTWPSHYEHDGVDQFRDGAIDLATNGIDDNGAGGVDDPTERETAAPYNVPLRGIKISLRMIEPDSRQVRQLSVINDFTPE